MATIGRQIKLYQEALGTSNAAKTRAGLATTAKEIKNVTDIGSSELTRDVTEYSEFGQERVKKIAGQINAGDFTFDVAFSAADTKHAGLLNAPVSTTAATTFGVDDGTNLVWLSGIVTSASLAPSIDGVTTLSVTVSVTDGPTLV